MIGVLVGASLMTSFLIYGVSERGRLWMIRRIPQGARVRRVLMMIAGILLLLDVLVLLLPVLPEVRDGVATLGLVAIASSAIALHRAFPHSRITEPVASRALAIGAHPDDLELACGGTLAKLVDAGYEVHALVMSPGQAGGDSSRRPDEARAGAMFLGAAQVEVLDFPDTALQSCSQEMVSAIESRVRALEPDLVLTHSEHDLHQDHQAVHLATLRAARRHSSILCFESPSATRSFNPSVFVDIRSHLEIKIEAIRRHHDQSGKPYMTAETVRGTASFRGSQSRTALAEGFEPVRFLAPVPGLPTIPRTTTAELAAPLPLTSTEGEPA